MLHSAISIQNRNYLLYNSVLCNHKHMLHFKLLEKWCSTSKHVAFIGQFDELAHYELYFVPQVSLELTNATVTYDHTRHSPESLAEAIEDMGFECSLTNATSTPVQTETKVFSKAGCSTDSIQQARSALAQTKGVVETQEGADSLAVTFAPSLVSVERLGEVMSCLVPDAEEGPSSRSSSGVEAVKMRIEGMVCLSCTTTIEGKIGKLKGVEKIKGMAF